MLVNSHALLLFSFLILGKDIFFSYLEEELFLLFFTFIHMVPFARAPLSCLPALLLTTEHKDGDLMLTIWELMIWKEKEVKHKFDDKFWFSSGDRALIKNVIPKTSFHEAYALNFEFLRILVPFVCLLPWKATRSKDGEPETPQRSKAY